MGAPRPGAWPFDLIHSKWEVILVPQSVTYEWPCKAKVFHLSRDVPVMEAALQGMPFVPCGNHLLRSLEGCYIRAMKTSCPDLIELVGRKTGAHVAKQYCSSC